MVTGIQSSPCQPCKSTTSKYFRHRWEEENLSALCRVSYENTECSWAMAEEMMFSFLHVTGNDRRNKSHAHQDILSAGETPESILKSILI